MDPQNCPICQLENVAISFENVSSSDRAELICKRCGTFAVNANRPIPDIRPTPKFLLEKGVPRADVPQAMRLFRAYLSIYTRECTESGRKTETLDFWDVPQLERLAETYAYTPVPAKIDKLLRLLERRTAFAGSRAKFDAAMDYPAVHAVDPAEFAYYKRALNDEGLIQTSDIDLQQAIISPSGWAKLGSSGTNSRRVFVAMSFDPTLEIAFTNGIEKAIFDAGYEPLRVDRVLHNDKICDRIVVEIRRSRFLVADVTQHRQGVYFEAGFAMGLGLPVIWSCQKEDLRNAHFDTRQYNHIVWDAPDDLHSKLRDRIDVTMSTGRSH